MNTYQVITGRWLNGSGTVLAVGYSGGGRGVYPQAVNNPYYEDQPDVGPIPAGLYKIGKPYDHPVCGPVFMPLTPSPETDTYGRSGFGIHGDLIGAVGLRAASDGCIILPLDVRLAIASNLAVDDDLEVVNTVQETKST